MTIENNLISDEVLICDDSDVDGSSDTTNTKYTCEAFKFNKEKMIKHDNADSLSIYNIPNSSYNIVIKTSDWENYDGLVVWIEPDSISIKNALYITFWCKLTIRGYNEKRWKRILGFK